MVRSRQDGYCGNKKAAVQQEEFRPTVRDGGRRDQENGRRGGPENRSAEGLRTCKCNLRPVSKRVGELQKIRSLTTTNRFQLLLCPAPRSLPGPITIARGFTGRASCNLLYSVVHSYKSGLKSCGAPFPPAPSPWASRGPPAMASLPQHEEPPGVRFGS